jgi:Zn-dependent protease
MLNTLFSNPILFVISVISLLVALTIHEFSHAWMADYLGDPTARIKGRLTLNPIAHLDAMGVLFMAFFGFGWGKPVPVDLYNLKNPRKDAALISLAGPMSNIVLAIVIAILIKLFIVFKLYFLQTIGYIILVPIVMMNLSLGVFNLLPISPLDGFKIVGGILSQEKAHEWYQLERYGMIFLILLIFPISGSSMLDIIIWPVVRFLQHLLLPIA